MKELLAVHFLVQFLLSENKNVQPLMTQNIEEKEITSCLWFCVPVKLEERENLLAM